ncbi:MAG: thiol reductant ABC exporter subunit CydD [Actinomyces bouchesdurhonensis]|jgi:thiol reductant ABC exporter, cydD subunit|uniref:Thiol reductant ABC exporter subunit CydD n=1 Tax=Actinomyces bouchesdurhonensis TaxID=1852361 RepID=A0A929RQ52_9ACTO|nr:thiol reductant ABC exporter subunit CydD [Actinomyces bouchesdurhonensis]
MVSVRPFDPRLLRYARSARTPIALTALLGTVTALLVLAQALLISAALSPVVSGSATLTDILPAIAGVAAVFALRAMVVAGREAIAARAATNAIIELRKRVINASIALGPRWRATNSAQTATLLSTGLEDLRPYFVSFLPQLVLVCTVTPAALGVILLLDFWSALIALLVLPLIPIFMILIGRFTEAASQDKLETMKRLTAQLLDLMSGLPTLRALGREKAPRAHLRALGKANTKATMATLRVAFLSGAVLEFLTTLSVALVAVEVGMRLVFGNISLFHGLAVIMLAPEVFEPLRQVGAQFHASANGVAASRAAFDIIEQADDTAHPGTTACPDMSATDIVLNGVGVHARGAWGPAPTSGVIRPGTVTAFAGPSGAGKSTLVACLLADVTPDVGQIRLRPQASNQQSDELDLADVDPVSWRSSISWVPQSPTLVPGTILDNMGGLRTPDLEDAAHATGFDAVLSTTPHGWDTTIGSGGVGLSVGQRQRLALTRALAARSQIVVLDEPTAHLDAVSEETVVRSIRAMRARGATVIVIAHRSAIIEVADQIIDVASANEVIVA